MALTDESNNMVMPVAPMCGGNGGGFGFGNDWGWIILLLLFAGGGWGNGFGGGFGNMALGYDFPWLLNGQNGINANTNAGFQNAMLNDGITSIRDGISGLSTQLCNSTGNIQQTINSGFANAEIAANARQIADMQTAFAGQTAMAQGFNNLQAQLAQCCCDNRAATQDVKYTIATEACANRATSTANTQAILDKLCQLELDNFKRENDQLRTQLNFANLQASQVAQTAEIRANNATTANQLVAELRSCPIPSQPVYGNQPIFTCGSNAGCGCGCA